MLPDDGCMNLCIYVCACGGRTCVCVRACGYEHGQGNQELSSQSGADVACGVVICVRVNTTNRVGMARGCPPTSGGCGYTAPLRTLGGATRTPREKGRRSGVPSRVLGSEKQSTQSNAFRRNKKKNRVGTRHGFGHVKAQRSATAFRDTPGGIFYMPAYEICV